MSREGRPVDTEWGFVLAISISIDEIESLRNREVELIGCEGEFTTYRTPDLDIDLGSIESRFILCLDEWYASFDEDFSHEILGLDPETFIVYIFFPESFLRVFRKSELHTIDIEYFEIVFVHFYHIEKFCFELPFTTVYMCIIHAE